MGAYQGQRKSRRTAGCGEPGRQGRAGTHRQTAPRRGGRHQDTHRGCAAHQRGQCTEAPHPRQGIHGGRGAPHRGEPAQSRGGPGSREDARRRACSPHTACADTGGPRGLRVTRRQRVRFRVGRLSAVTRRSRAYLRSVSPPMLRGGLPTMGGIGPARPDEQGEGRQVARIHSQEDRGWQRRDMMDCYRPRPGAEAQRRRAGRAARGAPEHMRLQPRGRDRPGASVAAALVM